VGFATARRQEVLKAWQAQQGPSRAVRTAPPLINPANTIDDAYLTRMTDPLLAKRL
jgi:hypothetical protein